MKKRLLTTLTVAIMLAMGSCMKAPTTDQTPATGMSALQVPAGFTWESSHTVTFVVNVSDTRFQNAIQVVTIYDGDPSNGGNAIATGSATVSSPFRSNIYLSNQIKEVYIVKTAPDNSITLQVVPVSSNNIAVSLGVSNQVIQSQPSSGAHLTGLSLAGTDTDGDGVPDAQDAYPTDPTKAYNTYYPSSSSYATVAFEDQWPKKGDYDLNDLVMGYQYTIVTNASNVVVQIKGAYELMATGGNSANGFGVQFPIASSIVSGVTGATLEAGQTDAVLIIFSNMRNEMATWNTQPGITQTAIKNYNVSFNLTNGPSIYSLSIGLHNPFIYNANNRGQEVHLPGEAPTNLADASLFGTGDDNTNVSAGRYYVTKTGLPYGISIPVSPFSYPIEGIDVTKAFLHLGDWVTSNGSSYTDWYSNTGTGYRNTANIYTH